MTAEELEQKCVLLNSLLYYDELELRKGKLTSIVEDSMKESKWKVMMEKLMPPGGITGSKPEIIISDILNDPYFANMEIVEYTLGENVKEFTDEKEKLSISSGGPVIMCVKNTETKDVFFVHRGTNQMEWLDNAKGLTEVSTRMQRHALDFFEKTVEKYGFDKEGHKLYTTGHSKGGNKAQFIAIASKYLIEKCVNFDGQGFSLPFVDKYKDIIAERASRILTIAAHADPVHQLGVKIAGEEKLYVTNQNSISPKRTFFSMLMKAPGINIIAAHSPGAIVNEKDNTTQLNKTAKERAVPSKFINDITLHLMKKLPKEKQEFVFSSCMQILSNMYNSKKPEIEQQRVILNGNGDRQRTQKEITAALAIVSGEMAKLGIESTVVKSFDRFRKNISNIMERPGLFETAIEMTSNLVIRRSKDDIYKPDYSLDDILIEKSSSRRESIQKERDTIDKGEDR